MSDGAGRRILVVDDDEGFRASIRHVFEAEGWEVTEAPDGSQALALLRSPLLPDVVVLDLVIPMINGFAVLTELRGSRGLVDLPVVAVSARKGVLANRLALTLGADDCTTKPVDLEALRSRCDALAARHAARRLRGRPTGMAGT